MSIYIRNLYGVKIGWGLGVGYQLVARDFADAFAQAAILQKRDRAAKHLGGDDEGTSITEIKHLGTIRVP